MTLLELAHLVRRRWYVVLICAIVFTLVTAVYSWGFLTNNYTSEVSLYVLTKTESSSSDSSYVTSSDMSASQQLANDVAVLAKSDRVVKAAAQKLGLDDLKDYDISVSSATTNRVITLSVVGKDPAMAAKVADQVAEQVATTAVEIMDLKAVNIVDNALVPSKPSGPNRLLYTGVALLAGIFVALALIVLSDMLNTKITSAKEAEDYLGLPVLATIPDHKEEA